MCRRPLINRDISQAEACGYERVLSVRPLATDRLAACPTASLKPTLIPMTTQMTYVPLGKTGVKVSRLCLGVMSYGSPKWRDWVLDEKASRPFYEKALAAGINFFDTADVYSNGVSEEILGRAIKDLVPDREDVVIASKCYNGTMDHKLNRWGLSRKHIMDACDRSLKRLGMDYIDLYQIHRHDDTTPMEECSRPCTIWSKPARFATSALRRCMPGNSPAISIWRTCTAGRASSPCRTTTTSSIAKRNAR